MNLHKLNRDFQGPGETFGGGIVPAIGGAILGTAGQFYDTYQRSKDVKNQIAAQKQEQELAYQRQVEMWHMQNAYNTPEQQMQRFGAAGLNPHLIYGQGSSGQAGTPPAYQPPHIQMQGASPPYGAAIGSALPTLMAVGTWMQNMRMSETQIQGKDQLIEYLAQKYPHEIRGFDQKEGLWPYQGDVQRSLGYEHRIKIQQMLEQFRHEWGDDLNVPAYKSPGDKLGPVDGRGLKATQALHEAAKARLTGLQADWYSPAAIMKLVLGGIAGMTRVIPKTAARAAKPIVKTSGRKIITRFDSKGRRVYQRQE